jgi:ABC-type branched-subunit amino acid transport system ATPase component
VPWAGVPGAIIGRGLDQAVQSLQDYQLLLTGTITVVVIMWFHRGIAGTLTHWWWKLAGKRPIPAATETTQTPETNENAETTSEVAVIAAAESGRMTFDFDPIEGSLFDVTEISVNFGGVQALQDVSLSLGPGEVVALVGPNGSGKTTCVNVASGRIVPDSGTVRLAGVDITRRGMRERVRLGVSRTFQLVSLCESMTLLENVMLGGHLAGKSGFVRAVVPGAARAEEAMLRQRALRALSSAGILELMAQHPSETAAGSRRLAEICRCLMSEASHLLLDEPASGLNAEEMANLGAMVHALAASGRGVLLIEHDLRFALNFATRVVVLDQGRVAFEGSPDAMRQARNVGAAFAGRGECRSCCE